MTQVLESAHAVGAFTGHHAVAELEGVDATLLDDVKRLRKILASALTEAGATVLDVTSKRFHPQGVTVLLLLSESHASLHTYPEIGSAFMDVFTCGSKANPELAVQLVARSLQASVAGLQVIRRGAAQ